MTERPAPRADSIDAGNPEEFLDLIGLAADLPSVVLRTQRPLALQVRRILLERCDVKTFAAIRVLMRAAPAARPMSVLLDWAAEREGPRLLDPLTAGDASLQNLGRAWVALWAFCAQAATAGTQGQPGPWAAVALGCAVLSRVALTTLGDDRPLTYSNAAFRERLREMDAEAASIFEDIDDLAEMEEKAVRGAVRRLAEAGVRPALMETEETRSQPKGRLSEFNAYNVLQRVLPSPRVLTYIMSELDAHSRLAAEPPRSQERVDLPRKKAGRPRSGDSGRDRVATFLAASDRAYATGEIPAAMERAGCPVRLKNMSAALTWIVRECPEKVGRWMDPEGVVVFGPTRLRPSDSPTTTRPRKLRE
jgi:hypothetical protein